MVNTQYQYLQEAEDNTQYQYRDQGQYLNTNTRYCWPLAYTSIWYDVNDYCVLKTAKHFMNACSAWYFRFSGAQSHFYNFFWHKMYSCNMNALGMKNSTST